MRREVYAFTKAGERVFLGHVPMEDSEVISFLETLAKIYSRGGSGYFSLKSAVFDARAFAGVLVWPPANPIPED